MKRYLYQPRHRIVRHRRRWPRIDWSTFGSRAAMTALGLVGSALVLGSAALAVLPG